MVDANQSRFSLFLGEGDWRRFRVASDPLDLSRKWTNLGEDWDDLSSSGTVSWNPASGSLILAPRTQGFRSSPHDAFPVLDRRRAATMDRSGNIYRISTARDSILVTNSGDGTETPFWPVPDAAPPAPKGSFSPLRPNTGEPLSLSGLAILPGHRIVVGVRGGKGSFLVFDLAAGGAPLRIEWKHPTAISVWDISTDPWGGIAVLDREAKTIWRLDRTLDMYRPGPTPQESPFEPFDKIRRRATSSPSRTLSWKLSSSHRPVSVECLPDGSCLVLEHDDDRFGRLARYVDGALRETFDLQESEGLLVSRDKRPDFRLQGHDIVLDTTIPERPSVVVVSEEGNQAWRFSLELEKGALKARPLAQELPLRRYDGTALVATPAGPFYCSDGIWVPLVELRRRRYSAQGCIQAPRLDGRIPGTTWHRVVFDGQIPPGASVTVSVRAADTLDELDRQAFHVQPAPVLRRSGSEIAWSRMPTDPDAGTGTWELLLQSIKGRHLDVRIAMACDEMRTPAIHSLRIWNPRFSYLDAYLPSIYREDETSRDFLERFLANFEGLFTSLEDRIVHSNGLYDVRTAPAATLDWLAGWLGLVFDPSMGEARRRQLLHHAPSLFAYRGTPQGILLGLRIGLSENLCEQDFELPLPSSRQVFGLRLVEHCTTRGRSPAFSGQTMADLTYAEATDGAWNIGMGRVNLMDRWRAFLASSKVASRPEFTPVPPRDPVLLALWTGFCQHQFGAVPTLSASIREAWGNDVPAFETLVKTEYVKEWKEVRAMLPGGVAHRLSRWQGYLRRRWGRIEKLREAWGASWEDFDSIPPFDVVPEATEALRDWAAFETFLEPVQNLSHRFRVLIPTTGPLDDRHDFERKRDHAKRIVSLEKPAHTSFDVQPYWALFRVGQARLGIDSSLDEGSRSDKFAPWLRIGSSQVGATRIFPGNLPEDRIRLEHAFGKNRGG